MRGVVVLEYTQDESARGFREGSGIGSRHFTLLVKEGRAFGEGRIAPHVAESGLSPGRMKTRLIAPRFGKRDAAGVRRPLESIDRPMART